MRAAIGHYRDVGAHTRCELFGAELRRRLRGQTSAFGVHGNAWHRVKGFIDARPGTRKPQWLTLIENAKLAIRVRDRGRRRNDLSQARAAGIRLWIRTPRGDSSLLRCRCRAW